MHGYVNKYYKRDTDARKVCSFNLDEETSRNEPWTGGTTVSSNIKLNLDCFLSGETFTGTNVTYDYGIIVGRGGFIEKYKEYQFRESLGEYTYNSVNSEEVSGATNVKGQEKRVIIYTLIKE